MQNMKKQEFFILLSQSQRNRKKKDKSNDKSKGSLEYSGCNLLSTIQDNRIV